MKRLTLTAVFLALFIAAAYADTDSYQHTVTISIPEIALVDVEGANVSLSISVPGNEAGEAPVGGTNSNAWLNYTSTVELNKTRTVTVQSNSNLSGLGLYVTAANYTGQGAGVLGTSAGEKKIESSAVAIVTGIGSCYTGTGTNNGHQLTYRLAVENMGSVTIDNTNVIVIYTITNDN
ncbi:MAG: hypothetical protein ONA69_09250 [candidate division KSB1 bacterium]|nr:hypothetical protein [candidate division KSB1 bacterium]MDZ7346962.1 hypothetical protein [candidate division KSB1 bacterium]